MKALLITDIQNDFLPGGALAVAGADLVIPVINRMQRDFELIVATKDWHPPHHISFASTHGKQPGEQVSVQGRSQELWPDHCVQGSWGADFAPALHVERLAQVFYKGEDPSIDSYSAFFDNARLRSTGLSEYLKQQGVEQLWVVGLTTDYCVKYSVLDACSLGFEVTVALEGCCGIGLHPTDIPDAFEQMKRAGARLLGGSDPSL